MTARQKGKVRKSKMPKVSMSKLSNKRLNKLAKQNKMNKSQKKQLVKIMSQRGKQPLEEIRRAEESEDIPLEEVDYEYFATNARNYGFLRDLDIGEKKRNKKRKADDNYANVEGLYAKRPKPESENRNISVKALLPIKTNGRIVPVTIEVEEKQESDEETENRELVEESEDRPESLTPLEEVVREEKKLVEDRALIRELAASVMASPEENVQKLKELHSFLGDENPPPVISIRKLAVASLTSVFLDIIPGYKIRLLTETERKQSMKKETKAIHAYEEALLNNYHRFLESLGTMATGKRVNKKKGVESKKKPKGPTTVTVPKSLRRLAIQSLCDLLVKCPHFNFRTEIIAIVLRFVTNADAELSDLVCETVKRLFSEDKCGEVSLEVIRVIGKIIKVKDFNVNPKVLDTFLSLKIKEVEKTGAKVTQKKKTSRDEGMKKLSKREKKRQKAMDYLDKELRSAAAEQDFKLRLRLHTQIINLIFLTYFRILKQAPDSRLLANVLEGLAKFAHLIDATFFDDLFATMTDLVVSGELTTRCSLLCVQTASTLLLGQGEALNIDPVRFYNHLYKTLLQLNASKSSEDEELPVALNCLHVLITKRRRQLSDQRLLAFLKRLCTLSVQLTESGALKVLELAKKIVVEFPKADLLLSHDSFGNGIYMPEVDEPDYCNAANTSLFELHLLRKSFDPRVREAANAILKKSSGQRNNRPRNH